MRGCVSGKRHSLQDICEGILLGYTNCSVATQLPQFYTHSESVDFPRKITTSSCVGGSTGQNAYPASRNVF